jgi:hypothetical protein
MTKTDPNRGLVQGSPRQGQDPGSAGKEALIRFEKTPKEYFRSNKMNERKP